MSLISQVRSVVQDKPVYTTDRLTVTAGTLSIRTLNYPLIAGSVTVTSPDAVPAFTVDVETGAITFGSVTSAQELAINYKFVLLSDVSIQDIIDVNGGDDEANVRLVAADVLDAMASLTIQIQKKIKLLDLTTDGPAMADAMRKHSATLRALVFNPEFQESGFDIAEQVQFEDTPAFVELVTNDFWRNNG